VSRPTHKGRALRTRRALQRVIAEQAERIAALETELEMSRSGPGAGPAISPDVIAELLRQSSRNTEAAKQRARTGRAPDFTLTDSTLYPQRFVR
jgi:hypothetical protein